MTWAINDTLKQGPRPSGAPSPDVPPAPPPPGALTPTWTEDALPHMGPLTGMLPDGDEAPLRWPMDVRAAMEAMGMCPDDTWHALGTMMRRGVVEM